MKLALLTFSSFFLWQFPIGSSAYSGWRNFASEKEFECFSQEKIYHKPTNACYKFLTTGPCRRGHWFVLEKPKESLRGTINATIKAKCAREICSAGEYYWRNTNSCVRAKDRRKLCPDNVGEELLTNVFGEGECTCTRDPPRARPNGDGRNRCYLLYSQGPCPPGNILGYSERSDYATCIRDPCHEETIYKRRKGVIGKHDSLALWENGACYVLGTRGPCPEGFTFKLNPKTNRPNCETFFSQIFVGIRPCDLDVNRNCQKKALQRRKSTAERFMKELMLELRRRQIVMGHEFRISTN